jgi:hypothetical protein
VSIIVVDFFSFQEGGYHDELPDKVEEEPELEYLYKLWECIVE